MEIPVVLVELPPNFDRKYLCCLEGIEPLGNIPLGPVAKFRDTRAPAETMVSEKPFVGSRDLFVGMWFYVSEVFFVDTVQGLGFRVQSSGRGAKFCDARAPVETMV